MGNVLFCVHIYFIPKSVSMALRLSAFKEQNLLISSRAGAGILLWLQRYAIAGGASYRIEEEISVKISLMRKILA